MFSENRFVFQVDKISIKTLKAYILVLVFGTIFQHVNEVGDLIIYLRFQFIETSAETKVSQIPQHESSLFVPSVTFRIENAYKSTVRKNNHISDKIGHEFEPPNLEC